MSQFSYNKTQHPFFDTLQQRVYSYFEEKQLDMTGGGKLMFKAALFIAAAVVNYCLLLFVVPVGWCLLGQGVMELFWERRTCQERSCKPLTWGRNP